MLTLTFLLLALQSDPAERRLLEPDLFGVAVDAAGDLNGDGVPDLWIGDPTSWGSRDRVRGRAWAVSCADGTNILRIDAPDGSKGFGWTIASLFKNKRVGARQVAIGCTQPNGDAAGRTVPYESAVYVHSCEDGKLAFVVFGAGDDVKEPWFSSAAGPTLASVGDWNGDGLDDLAIGWSYADGDVQDQGRVQVVSGRDGSTLHDWFGLEHHDRFGFALAKLDDIDGDGCAELAASAVSEVRFGAEPEALNRRRAGYVRILSSKGEVIRTIHAPDGAGGFGFSLASFPESKLESPGVIVGSAHAQYARFAVTRWDLTASANQWIQRPPRDAWDGGWMTRNTSDTSTEVRESFATRVLAIPDRDGDGQPDILVTEPQAFCHVPAGVLSSKRRRDAQAVPIGRVELGNLGSEYSHIGIACCSIADLDGDGVPEIVLSGASVRCQECDGTTVIVSGKTLEVLRTFTRAGRE